MRRVFRRMTQQNSPNNNLRGENLKRRRRVGTTFFAALYNEKKFSVACPRSVDLSVRQRGSKIFRDAQYDVDVRGFHVGDVVVFS